MSLKWEQVVVDAVQPAALGRWWANALGSVVPFEAADEFEIRPAPDRLPGFLFVPVGDPRVTKNRLHPDFRPGNQAAEVDRLLELGARRTDVGQGSSLGSCSPIRRATSSASFHLEGVSRPAPSPSSPRASVYGHERKLRRHGSDAVFVVSWQVPQSGRWTLHETRPDLLVRTFREHG
jgi:hypothetical protein